MELFFNVDEQTYKNKNCDELFSPEIQYKKVYAMMCWNHVCVKFAWYSWTINPDIFELSSNIFSFCIDTFFAVYDFPHKKIVFKLDLDTYYLCHFISQNKLFLFCELSMLVFDVNKNYLIETYDFPEIMSSYRIEEDFIVVKLLDDRELSFKM